MSCDQTSCMNHGRLQSSLNKRHEEHGSRNPSCWDRDNEETSFPQSIILACCVCEGEDQRRHENVATSEKDVECLIPCQYEWHLQGLLLPKEIKIEGM